MENRTLNLETRKYHLMSYRNEYKVFLYDKTLIQRVNKVLKGYAAGTQFKLGEEAIFTFSSNQFDMVTRALGIRELPVPTTTNAVVPTAKAAM